MDKKIFQKFRELRKRALNHPFEGCFERMNELAEIIRECDPNSEELNRLKLTPKNENDALIPKGFKESKGIYWDIAHYVLEYNGRVFDPVLGIARTDNYLDTSFRMLKKEHLAVERIPVRQLSQNYA